MDALFDAPVELELPSDHRVQELEAEIRDLRAANDIQNARIKGLQMANEALQRRMADTVNQWKDIQAKLRAHEVSDIITDYISEWYHSDLLKFLAMTDSSFSSWNAVSEQLTIEAREGRSDLKQKCMALAQMTPQEWDALCLFKKNRNLRVHPRRSKNVVQRIMKDIQPGTLKTALNKMFDSMKGVR